MTISPRAPWLVYRDSGWVSWGHFLGTDIIAPRLRKYRSYEDACKFIHPLGIKGKDEWVLYAKGKMSHLPLLPEDIPKSPVRTYSLPKHGKKWTTWGDFLGTGKIGNKHLANQYLPYNESRAFAVALNLKSSMEWKKYITGAYPTLPKLPSNIPKKPDQVYDNFTWSDFLGYPISKMNCKREFWSFEKARDFVHKLGLKRWEEWNEYCAGKFPHLPVKPLEIPSNPSKKYKGNGWNGYADWMGYFCV